MLRRRGSKETRSLAAAMAITTLAFVVCCAIIVGMTAPQRGRPVLESLDADEETVRIDDVECACVRERCSDTVLRHEQKLHIDNVLAARDVAGFADHGLPGPGEREGFDNQDAFMRAHEGTQINIAKNLDEADKFSPFPADRDELLGRNEDNKHQLKAFLAKQDADEKRDVDKVLGDWEDHRQSLQDEVEYQDKMNGVLNDNADRVGELLVRHTKATTEAAEDVADQEERSNEIQLKKFTANLETRQEDLAAQITGLPDPSEPSEDEKSLLKQNIMVGSRQ